MMVFYRDKRLSVVKNYYKTPLDGAFFCFQELGYGR